MRGSTGLLKAIRARAVSERIKLGRVLQLSRYRSVNGQHSVARQICEMLALRLLRGIGPEYYHTAGFWDKRVPWKDKLDHVGAAGYSRFVVRLNPINYQKMSQNKITEKSVLSLFSIPTPRFIGFLHAVTGRDRNGKALRSIDDLAALLASLESDRICFKLPEGWAGRSFQAVELVRIGSEVRLRALNRAEALSVNAYAKDFLESGRDRAWLIEEYFEQHPWYKSLHPSSLNTMRLWVLKSTRNTRGQVMAGYLRMGQRGSLVDNRQAGGLVAAINIESEGVLGAVVDGLGGELASSCHPETGVRVEGKLLPYWEEAKALAVDALDVFPNMRFAGVDVAVGPQGPVIIELNVEPSMIGAAITGTPLRRIAV